MRMLKNSAKISCISRIMKVVKGSYAYSNSYSSSCSNVPSTVRIMKEPSSFLSAIMKKLIGLRWNHELEIWTFRIRLAIHYPHSWQNNQIRIDSVLHEKTNVNRKWKGQLKFSLQVGALYHLKGVSHEIFRALFWHVWIDLGLYKNLWLF